MIIISENERRKIIPFASGKGGTGKTIIAANIAIRLAEQGRKVLLVDMDLGGSNAHTYLHIKNQHYGIANYIYNEQLSFGEIIQNSHYQNLDFIAGDALSPGAARIKSDQLQVVLDEMTTLPYDYIIIDLASGCRPASTSAFAMVNAGMLVITPDIVSVLNAYNFFKNAIFDMMLRYAIQESGEEVIEYLQSLIEEQLPNSTPKINEILLKIERIDSNISTALREQVYAMKPFVILNRINSDGDMERARDLQNLIYKNMNIELECLGAVFEDSAAIKRALEAKVPLVHTELESRTRENIDRMAQKILLSPDFPILPLDVDMYDGTFGLVEIEIQHDTEQEPQDIAALEREEYVALIESLNQRIAELEKGGVDDGATNEPVTQPAQSTQSAQSTQPTQSSRSNQKSNRTPLDEVKKTRDGGEPKEETSTPTTEKKE